MTNTTFSRHGIREGSNGSCSPAQDDAFQAIVVIKMRVHGGDGQIVLAMLQGS